MSGLDSCKVAPLTSMLGTWQFFLKSRVARRKVAGKLANSCHQGCCFLRLLGEGLII